MGANTPPAAALVAIVSDDDNKVELVKHLLALSKHIECDFIELNLAQLQNQNQHHNPVANADLILVDRACGANNYFDIVKQLSALNPGAALPTTVVLLDEDLLASDIADIAAAVKAGVDDYVLTSELSLKKMLAVIEQPDTKSTHAMPAEPQPQTVYPAAAEAGTDSTQEKSEQAELHQLTIDMENQRVHISQGDTLTLVDDTDPMLSIDQWLELLDKKGAEDFRYMLKQASDFLNVPRSVVCTITSKAGITYPADINEIQIKENGKGRVVGINAQIVIGNTVINPLDDNGTVSGGFDNLGDGSTGAAVVDKTWKNIAESLPVMCLVLDQQGYIVRVVNHDRSSHHGFPDAYVGQTLNDLMGIESLDNYVECINKTLNTGKAHQQTIAYQSESGTRWFDTHITKMRGELGISRQVIWTAFDITASRQAYQELLKNHDALTDTLNDAPVLFCQKDTEGRYQRVNQAFCETFNVRAEVIAGRDDHEIFSAEACEQITLHDRTLAEHGGDATFVQTEKVSGQTVTVAWHKFAIKGHASNKTESIAAFGFIQNHMTATSDDHAADDPLILEPGIAMSEPTGAIGRDFKAIIKNVVAYTELAMAQKSLGRENRVIEYLSQLVSTSERARDLIIGSSSATIHDNDLVAVELKPLVRDIVQMLKPTLPPSLKFEANYDSAYGKAVVSPIYFQRMVMQLLISAKDSIKAQSPDNTQDSANNEVQLSLKNQEFAGQRCAACQEPLNGDYLVLSVKTPSGNIDEAGLQKMVDAASRAKDNAANGSKPANNIIAMAHSNNGHIILGHDESSITLNLLFKQVLETGDDDSDRSNSGKEKRPSKPVASLSSL